MDNFRPPTYPLSCPPSYGMIHKINYWIFILFLGQALIKDLKKQLKEEQKRSEKLSEKMKEHFDPPSNFSEVSKGDVEPDRTSNSSWSIYSGNYMNFNFNIEPIHVVSVSLNNHQILKF